MVARHRSAAFFVLVATAALGSACIVPPAPADGDSDETSEDTGCVPGHADCECSEGLCLLGLVCIDDTCVSPTTGCVFTNNTAPCTDGNPCTSGDICGGGVCNSGPSDPCDDANSCTVDACDAVIGCYHSAASGGPCDDGNACTDSDSCNLPCTGAYSENFDGVTAPALPAGWSTAKLAGQAADAVWVTAASTDTPPNGAFRGFGAPQAHFASEIMITRLAHELGLDPVDIRRRNIYREGGIEPTGHPLPAGVIARRRAPR